MDRKYVLDNFFNKLTEAKRQNVREVRMSLKEIDDLGFVIYELLGDYYTKTIDGVKSNKEDKTEEIKMDGGEF